MPPRKRAKTSKTASNRVVLKALAEMPLDIIFEIFGHLDPLDLLQLARTTKTLRATLMSRSSLSLWKRVRHAYYQMPDGPEGMSEPQYIGLALDNICYGCGPTSQADRAVSTRPFWNARLRSCHPCELNLLASEPKLKKFISSKALPPLLIVLLKDSHSDYRYSLKQVQLWLGQYASLSSSSAKAEWEAQILKEDTLSKKHVVLYKSWLDARRIEDATQRQRLIKDMTQALSIKLEELGWGEEERKIHFCERYTLENRLLMNGPKNFHQAWSSNGRSIVKYLKTLRAARLEKEWKALLSSRYKVLQGIYNEYTRGLPVDTLVPNIADVALSPPVHAIITDERIDFKVTQETFEGINIVQILPSIVSEWKTRLEENLIQMVQVTLSESFSKDHLTLATTVFHCDMCDLHLFYPHVLVHQCPRPFSGWPRQEDPAQCAAWNSSGSIKFNRNVHQAVIDIVDILGLDPGVVTTEEMIARNSVLQCLDCRKTRRGRITMVWSRAIDHSRNEHNCRPAMVSWKVPGHQGQLTLQASLQELAFSDPSSRSRFMCSHCRYKSTLFDLKHHLLTTHNIRDPGDDDILPHPDVNRAPMPSVLPDVD